LPPILFPITKCAIKKIGNLCVYLHFGGFFDFSSDLISLTSLLDSLLTYSPTYFLENKILKLSIVKLSIEYSNMHMHMTRYNKLK